MCDRSTPDQVAAQLRQCGVDVESLTSRGQVEIVDPAVVYLAGGAFVPVATVGFYEGAAQRFAEHGYPVTCVVGEMCWSRRGCPGSERLLEYEALYQQEFDGAATISLCLYDLDQTRWEHILDLLRLHARVVLNGIEMNNPCPDDTLLVDTSTPADEPSVG